jgi:hypothetical protein
MDMKGSGYSLNEMSNTEVRVPAVTRTWRLSIMIQDPTEQAFYIH